MKANQKLSYAIVAALSAHSGATRAAPAEGELADIVVTAQRRSESIQDVPITIQALTGKTLGELNVLTFDDFLKFLPSVTAASNGPGQSEIYMRGLSVGFAGEAGAGSRGAFPNVAVYLDEQSAQLPGRNLDVYAADIERIEVLEGPQGTLFGAGAEAGVVRYITAKPKLGVTEGNFVGTYGTTAHGDQNSSGQAMVNLPLIDETLAVRGVVFVDRRGGYIDNVPSTFTRKGTDLGLCYRMGGTKDISGNCTSPGQVPADSVVINNSQVVADAINPVTYQGIRAELLWKINDKWDALLTQSYQDMDAEGVFYQQPKGSEGNPLGRLQVTLFNPSYDKDRFENTALTVNGTIDDWKLVYNGSYLVRNIDQVQDYTNYARGVFGTYYQCTGYSIGYDPVKKCYSPSSTWHDTERATHLTQEFRVSSPADKRLRALAGLYWEDFQLDDDINWLYRSVPTCTPTFTTECFLNVAPRPGQSAKDPSVRNDSTAFFNDFQRTVKQTAIFSSIDFDLVPKTLTLTAGTRYYKFDQSVVGGNVSSFYCKFYAGNNATNFGPCSPTNFNGLGPGGPFGTNLNTQPVNSSNPSGFRSRVNLSWKVTESALLYATWSQGYRPGGFNAGTACFLPLNGVNQWCNPLLYSPDSLVNKEIGWKTDWLGRTLQFNGAIYEEDWNNVQVTLFCPQCGLGNVGQIVNGPAYRVRGVEMSIIARAGQGLTIQASGSYNKTEQTNSPYLMSNNNVPGNTTLGQPITSIPNVYGASGSPLANSPKVQANLRARYDWNVDTYKLFAQASSQYQDSSLSATGNVSAFEMPSWVTFDAAIGIAKGSWAAELYGQNLTDRDKSLFTNNAEAVVTETVMRPRVLGIKVSYGFGGE